MNKPVIAANWKMNMTKKTAGILLRKINESVSITSGVIIIPPFTLLDMAYEILDNKIKLGAQNCYWKKSGAFTGEISPQMLVDIGCKYVIIGHSERRHIFGESDALLRKKLIAAIEAGLTPIYCVGETLEEKREGKKEFVLNRQLDTINGISSLIVAYEPVWAIGTGVAAGIDQITEAIEFIKDKLKKKSSDAAVLYGGSVKPDNSKEIAKQHIIDGVLVGGASLDAESFLKIIDSFKR